MRAFIRIQHSGDFYDQNCYSVYHGCSKLDISIVRYKAIYSVTDNAPTDLVVGAFSDVKVALERLGVNLLPILIIRMNYCLLQEEKFGNRHYLRLPVIPIIGMCL